MSGWNWIAELETLRGQGVSVVVATVCETRGSTPRDVGAKMFVLRDRSIRGSIGGGQLEALAIEDALECLQRGEAKKVRYPLGAKAGQCCGGIVEVLFECVNCNPSLYVFGGGHVGQAVCRTLNGTPFTVHLVEDRPEWIEAPDLPQGVIRHPCEWEDFVGEAVWDSQSTYAAVMTHQHDRDERIVADLLHRPLRYLGLIGSVSKWHRFRDRFIARGINEALLTRVKCPIGVSIPGKSPQEIAISFAAEILQWYYTPPGESHA